MLKGVSMAWNRPNKKIVKRPKSNHRRNYILSLAAVSIAIMAFLFLPTSPETDLGVQREINVEKKNIHNKLASRKVIPKEKQIKVDWKKKEMPISTRKKLSKLEETLRKRLADTNGTIRFTKPILKDPVNQLYFDVFARDLGDMPPMTPFLMEEDEVKAVMALNTKLLPEENDNEVTLFAKEVVNDVKDALNQYIKDGGTVNEFFDYYCHKLQSAFEFRQQAIISLNDIVKSEDLEAGMKYLEQVNAKLADEGIRPVEYSRAQLTQLEYNQAKEN